MCWRSAASAGRPCMAIEGLGSARTGLIAQARAAPTAHRTQARNLRTCLAHRTEKMPDATFRFDSTRLTAYPYHQLLRSASAACQICLSALIFSPVVVLKAGID